MCGTRRKTLCLERIVSVTVTCHVIDSMTVQPYKCDRCHTKAWLGWHEYRVNKYIRPTELENISYILLTINCKQGLPSLSYNTTDIFYEKIFFIEKT